MLRATEIELGRQVGAIDCQTRGPGAARLIAGNGDGDIRRSRRWRRCGIVAEKGAGDQVLESIIGVAQAVAQGDAIREIMLETDGADSCVGARAVVVGEGVIAAALDMRGNAIDERNTVVRKIVFLFLVVAQGQARRGFQPQAQSRRHAIAVVVNLIALHHAIGLVHQRDARRRRFAQGHIDIPGAAPVIDLAARHTEGGERREHGLLADAVDDPGGRAAPEQGRGRTQEHGKRIGIEGVALVLADIAHTVQEETVGNGEPAQVHRIAVRTALTGVQRDSRNIAQGVLDEGEVLLRQCFLVHGIGGL